MEPFRLGAKLVARQGRRPLAAAWFGPRQSTLRAGLRTMPCCISPAECGRRTMNEMFETMERMEREMLAPLGLASRFPGPRLFPTIPATSLGEETLNMQLDFHETDNNFEVTADLPGIRKEDIAIEVDNESGLLTVSGERKSTREEKSDGSDGEVKYHFAERSHGKATRSIRLPKEADTSNAKADYSDGVLTLTFPKREVAASSRLSIPVGDIKELGQADDKDSVGGATLADGA